MRAPGYLFALLLALAAVPAHAQRVKINAPEGTAAASAIAIARQTDSSIVIADPVIANRRVGAISGSLDPAEAVRKLAQAAGARALSVGPDAWRLVATPRQPQRNHSAAAGMRPAAVLAAPMEEPPVTEILVTASKRDSRLSDFSGQVSLIDGEDLAFGGVGGTEKITQRIATVSSTYLGSGRNKLFIRGIADSSFTGPTQATVGQYLGDLRLSYNAPDPDLRMSDLKQVEILEGPQGTLYGAGSLGGIIRLVPNEPELGVTSLSGSLGGSLIQHGDPGADANATLNLPLAGDDAALRVTVDAATLGGYIDKPLLDRDNVNRTEILGGRAMMRVDFAPGWTADIIGLAQSTHASDSQYADRFGPRLSRDAQVQEGSQADYYQGQLVVSGNPFGDVSFRSSTGVAWQDLAESYDATLPDEAPRLFTQRNDTRMIANETRLWQPLDDRFGWLAGLSYTDNHTRLTRSLGSIADQSSATGVLNTISEITGYGEASLRVFDGLIAAAGGRYTRSRLGGAGEDVPMAIAIAGREITASRTETAFLPSASLLAEVLPETNLYLRYQEGFRPGGLAIEGQFVRQFSNDHAATLEFGVRHGRPDRGPFYLSASLAHTRWKDIQADFIDITGLPSTANIGDGRVWTASLATSVELSPELRIDTGLTYNDSQIDEPVFAVSLRTGQVPNIAQFSGRVGFEYARPLGGELELKAHGWASYVGKSRLGIGPELGDPQGDYLDSGLTVRVGREGFGVSLGISNLADIKGNRFALGTPFAVGREQVTPLQPRSIRIGLDSSF